MYSKWVIPSSKKPLMAEFINRLLNLPLLEAQPNMWLLKKKQATFIFHLLNVF